jgi:hypothetical protein
MENETTKPPINGDSWIHCPECKYEGHPDAVTILGVGPIWGCPQCDKTEGYLEIIPKPSN